MTTNRLTTDVTDLATNHRHFASEPVNGVGVPVTVAELHSHATSVGFVARWIRFSDIKQLAIGTEGATTIELRKGGRVAGRLPTGTVFRGTSPAGPVEFPSQTVSLITINAVPSPERPLDRIDAATIELIDGHSLAVRYLEIHAETPSGFVNVAPYRHRYRAFRLKMSAGSEAVVEFDDIRRIEFDSPEGIASYDRGDKVRVTRKDRSVLVGTPAARQTNLVGATPDGFVHVGANGYTLGSVVRSVTFTERATLP